MDLPRQPTIPTPGLALVVLAVIATLYGVDKFLARQEQSELLEQAHSSYLDGLQSLRSGNPHLAVRQFQSAHVLDRANQQYLLSLASAELADNALDSARDTIDEILRKNSNDGQANLLMARAMVHEGKFDEAVAYYHRSIYGTWPPNSNAKSSEVRLELAGMLAGRGNNQELLSELLLLQNQSGLDLPTEKKIAALFLQAGSPQRAVDAYRILLQNHPDDLGIVTSLGRAYLVLGDYREARRTLEKAGALDRKNEAIKSELGLVARLADLDPTSRRLSSNEKFRRSSEILTLTETELRACLQDRPPSGKLEPLFLQAQTFAAEKMETTPSNETAESRLDLAEKLWAARPEVCNAPPPPNDPLALLMQKLAQ